MSVIDCRMKKSLLKSNFGPQVHSTDYYLSAPDEQNKWNTLSLNKQLAVEFKCYFTLLGVKILWELRENYFSMIVKPHYKWNQQHLAQIHLF